MSFEERVEVKLDKLDERLDSVDKQLAVYNKQLEIHIEGVNQNRSSINKLDDDIKPVKEHVAKMQGAASLLKITSMALGVLGSIAAALIYFIGG